jgi:very-short-patch-repair endonuclease
MTRARQPWKGTTQHERLFWRHLRNRQHPVDRYMVDFAALKPASQLSSTVVGHKFPNREALDQERTRFLASKNILVLRFWNYLINRELRSILETIWSTLKRRGNPSPRSSTLMKGRGKRARLPKGFALSDSASPLWGED